LGLVAVAFCFGLTMNSKVEAGADRSDKSTVASTAPAATFAANSASLGIIPDGVGTPTCGNPGGEPKDVTFTVSGLTGTVSTVEVNFNARHTWVNDLDVSLRAPTGTPNLLLFGRTGSTSTNDCGTVLTPPFGSNDLVSTNTYTFADSATANWWTTASSATLIPTSTNRTVVSGGPGVTNPPATTSLTTTFGGMTAAAANGTWTLRFTDRGLGDTGAVTAANLTITTGVVAPLQHIVDFNGDGKTDWVTVRNTGGGPTGQISWFVQENTGAAASYQFPWGQATDFFVPEDYDGDGKTDYAVWRPGPPGGAAWYILNSIGSTVRAENFGQTGDDPTIVGDYNNDNKADLSVYRAGAAAGDPSFWFYRIAAAGPIFARQWGSNGDFPAPGDYDGDGSFDFAIQRNAGGGQAAFWMNYAAAAPGVLSRYSIFGTPTDVIVPGDYDGDGKTDVAVIRGIGGAINWFYEPSTALNTFLGGPFGISGSDTVAQGDYDGDGKTDFAVWRPNLDPTNNFFYARKSTDGSLLANEWGQNGDYPVANYNTH
jgi:subtilisin-like proprotein convertase family protein